jgi:hypothetical protein
MTHLLQILFICILIILPIGCGETEKAADTKGIKIGELAATGKRVQPQMLHTTNIDVISYEVAADNIASLEGIWQILNPGSLNYNDSAGFAANGLHAAMGKFPEFQKVTAILKTANATKTLTTSLLMTDRQPELIRISKMPNDANISYIDRQGNVKTAEVGLGTAGLQVFAQQILAPSASSKPGPTTAAQLASVRVVPAILASTEGAAPAIAERLKEHDLRIYSAGFSSIMRPGEFIALAPSEYKQDENTAAWRFFTKSGSKPSIRIYLLVCVSIL